MKNELIERLRMEVNQLQGIRAPVIEERTGQIAAPMASSFPNKIFPSGAIHEFMSTEKEHAAATSGFMSALLSQLMRQDGLCLWVSNRRTVFPPALKRFGIEPDKVIFVDVRREKDLLWCIEETLKCTALTAIVGECKDLSLTASRRLQLAVEQSKVTGLLHRHAPRSNNPIATVARWKITQIGTDSDNLPGLNSIAWHVALQKIRNGTPGDWQLEWVNGTFVPVHLKQDRIGVSGMLKTG